MMPKARDRREARLEAALLWKYPICAAAFRILSRVSLLIGEESRNARETVICEKPVARAMSSMVGMARDDQSGPRRADSTTTLLADLLISRVRIPLRSIRRRIKSAGSSKCF